MKRKKTRTSAKRKPAPKPVAHSMVQCDSLIAAIKAMDRVIALADGHDARKAAARFLKVVEDGLEEHIVLSEGHDGLLPHVEHDRPRLVRWAHALRREHRDMTAQMRKIRAAYARLGGRRLSPRFVQMASDFHGTLRSHQEQGSELMFEAYIADLGAAAD